MGHLHWGRYTESHPGQNAPQKDNIQGYFARKNSSKSPGSETSHHYKGKEKETINDWRRERKLKVYANSLSLMDVGGMKCGEQF